MSKLNLFLCIICLGLTILIINNMNILLRIMERNDIISSSINFSSTSLANENLKSRQISLIYSCMDSQTRDSLSLKNGMNLLWRIFSTNVTKTRNESSNSVPLSKKILSELSTIIYKNMSEDVYSIERSMNRTLNRKEYVEIKEKYFSKEYYRDNYCFPDVGDILQKPSIKPIEAGECNAPLLTINSGGRVGNKICQYLSLFVLHTMYNANVAMYPKLDEALKLMFETRSIPIIPLNCTNTLTRETPSFNFVYIYLAIQRLISKEQNENYKYEMNEMFEAPEIFMRTNPCPIQLLMKRRNYLKNELRFLPLLQSNARKKMNLILPYFLDSTLVSIHIRRSDYENYAEKYGNKLLSPNYYQRAMSFFRNNSRFGKTLFLIFSDDIQWCKKHFIAQDIVIAGDGNDSNPYMDFVMISECDHHILGYGTFSFTAAFLGAGLLVYPLPAVPRERVFGTQNHYLCSNSPDLIPIPDIPLNIKNNL